MELIKLLVTSDNIKWDMPQENLLLFSAEFSCRIPYNFMGQHEICRYSKILQGVTLYATPVFSENRLVCLKAFFEQGDDLGSYHEVLNGVIAQLGQPIYAVKEELGKQGGLIRYPHNIWIGDDAIAEVGIYTQQSVPFGNILVTQKSRYKGIYTERYLREIGWRPPANLK
jgi:hypothetical protein